MTREEKLERALMIAIIMLSKKGSNDTANLDKPVSMQIDYDSFNSFKTDMNLDLLVHDDKDKKQHSFTVVNSYDPMLDV